MKQVQRYLRLILACFTIIPLIAFPQTFIKGKVISESTQGPLAGASIYLNNTSIGTSANDDGTFILATADIINAEVVVSFIGYDVLSFRINTAQDSSKFFVCKLKEKIQSLHSVLVISDDTKKKWLGVFIEIFLGITAEAKNTFIENLNDVYFTKGDNPDFLFAKSDTPLVIFNKSLGYKITFDLIEFSFNEKQGSYFYGYTRFENLPGSERLNKKRKGIYLGSTLHFYRSLINNTLQQEGYAIFLLKGSKKETHDKTITINNQRNHFFVTNIEDSLVAISSSSILFSDTTGKGIYHFKWEGDLQVQYYYEPSSKKYLNKHGYIEGSLHTGFKSVLQMLLPEVLLDKRGIPTEPLSVNYLGYWIYEKLANLLPNDYSPE